MYQATKDAVTFQRGLSEQEALDSAKTIEEEGGENLQLSAEEQAVLQNAVKPQLDAARTTYGDDAFAMIGL